MEELPAAHTDRVNVGRSSQSFKPFVRRAAVPKLQATEAPTRLLNEKSFQINQRVFHLKFGYGRVISFEGDKLEIDFDHSGVKKVMQSFVEKAE